MFFHGPGRSGGERSGVESRGPSTLFAAASLRCLNVALNKKCSNPSAIISKERNSASPLWGEGWGWGQKQWTRVSWPADNVPGSVARKNVFISACWSWRRMRLLPCFQIVRLSISLLYFGIPPESVRVDGLQRLLSLCLKKRRNILTIAANPPSC